MRILISVAFIFLFASSLQAAERITFVFETPEHVRLISERLEYPAVVDGLPNKESRLDYIHRRGLEQYQSFLIERKQREEYPSATTQVDINAQTLADGITIEKAEAVVK